MYTRLTAASSSLEIPQISYSKEAPNGFSDSHYLYFFFPFIFKFLFSIITPDDVAVNQLSEHSDTTQWDGNFLCKSIRPEFRLKMKRWQKKMEKETREEQ